MTTIDYLKWLVQKCEADPEFETNLYIRARLGLGYQPDIMTLFRELSVTPQLRYFKEGGDPYDISGGEGKWELATGDLARYTETTTTSQEVTTWRIK